MKAAKRPRRSIPMPCPTPDPDDVAAYLAWQVAWNEAVGMGLGGQSAVEFADQSVDLGFKAPQNPPEAAPGRLSLVV